MIRFVRGDILHSQAEALVNTVNTVGVMGKGIALHFRKRFPENYRFYREACERGEVVPGKVLVFRTEYLQPRYIINFPTKRHWRERSRLEDIEAGLDDLVRRVRELHIVSIAIPALGCGHGGLDWNQVRPLIEKAFASLPEVQVEVYEPEVPQEISSQKGVSRLKPSHAALLLLIHQYHQMEPETTLRDVHHLAYLLSSAAVLVFKGQRSGFRIKNGKLYSPAVSRLVKRLLASHSLQSQYGYRRKMLLSVPTEAVQQAQALLQNYPRVRRVLQRVVKLLQGSESSFALQLMALVMYHRKDTVFGQSVEQLLENRSLWLPEGCLRRDGVVEEQIKIVWESITQAEASTG